MKVERPTGVYCIRNLRNGKRYVGSSAYDFRERWWIHLTKLRKNAHCNVYLQRAFNKHGEDAFTFEILEKVRREECVKREQYWMDRYRSANPKYGYNRNPTAGSMLGFKHSEKTKRLVGEKSRGRKHTEETKRRIARRVSVALIGNDHFRGHRHSEDSKKKIAAATRKQWKNTKFRETISAKVSATLTGRKLSPEALAKRTAKQRPGLIARNKSLAMRRRVSKALMGHSISQETRDKIAATLRARNQSSKKRCGHAGLTA